MCYFTYIPPFYLTLYLTFFFWHSVRHLTDIPTFHLTPILSQISCGILSDIYSLAFFHYLLSGTTTKTKRNSNFCYSYSLVGGHFLICSRGSSSISSNSWAPKLQIWYCEITLPFPRFSSPGQGEIREGWGVLAPSRCSHGYLGSTETRKRPVERVDGWVTWGFLYDLTHRYLGMNKFSRYMSKINLDIGVKTNWMGTWMRTYILEPSCKYMQKDLGALTIEQLYMLGIDPSTWTSISAYSLGKWWCYSSNMVVKPSSRGLISQQYLQLETRKVRNLELW